MLIISLSYGQGGAVIAKKKAGDNGYTGPLPTDAMGTHDWEWSNGATLDLQFNWGDVTTNNQYTDNEPITVQFEINPAGLGDQLWVELGSSSRGMVMGLYNGDIYMMQQKSSSNTTTATATASTYLTVGTTAVITLSYDRDGGIDGWDIYVNNTLAASMSYTASHSFSNDGAFMTDPQGSLISNSPLDSSDNPNLNNTPTAKIWENSTGL